MDNLFEFELAKGANILVNELALIQKNERVIITADTLCDSGVINAVAGAAHTAGAKVAVMWRSERQLEQVMFGWNLDIIGFYIQLLKKLRWREILNYVI